MARQSTSERQLQIIEATQNLITSKGMEFVTIDAIAEKVGLTEGAIYKHFRSKREILTLLIDSIEQNLMETLVNSKQVGDSSLDHLGRILVAHLNDVEDRRAVSFIIISEAIAFDGIFMSDRVSLMLNNYLDFIKNVVDEGIKDRSIRPDVDIGAAANTFLGMIQIVATLWSLDAYAESFKGLRTNMWNIYRKGVSS
ncbi:MAG: TetR/AcrR family transcriptional regulator [Dehalococcoidia bacterium]|nr:TetR/AcrR family transcriptional regulator [Dehalococcoidia bacterium]